MQPKPYQHSCRNSPVSEKTLTVQLRGGLGNQLFCFAFGYALAKRLRRTLVLDGRSGFLRDVYGREFLLDDFPHLSARCLERCLPVALDKLVSPIQRMLSKLSPPKFRKWVEERPGLAFDGSLLTTDYMFKNVVFRGYWQSYRYFDECRTELCRVLEPPAPSLATACKLADRINSSRSCFVHWRSYDEELREKLRPSYHYYATAMHAIAANYPSVTFYVFSDSPAKAARLIPRDVQTELVNIPEAHGNRPALIDFYLMTQCDSGIVADSSFSWWAGYLLNAKRPSTIVAPGDVTPWGADWIPTDWLTIPNAGSNS